ncbi:MAG: GAF domain-containing protein [Halieaceae bacterium]|jgi:light-regulated signal transduction histidine kinase (bacteriophytochrome)|nr:GAF domain-containing protein [Halieaceae bacterium]
MEEEKNAPARMVATQITPEYEAICAREDLAHIGSIQSTGFLIVGQTRSGNIVQLSDNTPAALGDQFSDWPADRFLGLPVARIIGASWLQALRLVQNADRPVPIPLGDTEPVNSEHWRCIAHRCDGYLILEFLPLDFGQPPEKLDLRDAVASVTDADSVDGLAQRSAQAFQSLTGFDRVMLYRFLPDWSGEVIAEATAPSLPVLYFGSRFPASDIPAQARALYDTAGVRLITDTQGGVSRMVPTTPADQDQPLDMSRCLLRAVSVAHLDYLASMEVRQSMSVAIHHDDKLWGLIACHKGPGALIPPARFPDIIKAAERISTLIESVLEERVEREIQDAADNNSGRQESVRSAIHHALSSARAVGYSRDALVSLLSRIRTQQGFSCIGALMGEQALLVSDNGTVSEEIALVTSVAQFYDSHKRMSGKALLESRALHHDYPDAPKLPNVTGILAYRPIEYPRLLLFIGLEELVETITWAGNPNTVRTGIVDDRIAVRPRDSFEKWRVAERGKSRFWTPQDHKILFEIANGLRIWMTQTDRSELGAGQGQGQGQDH